jgi:PTS system mannose-specific IIA component
MYLRTLRRWPDSKSAAGSLAHHAPMRAVSGRGDAGGAPPSQKTAMIGLVIVTHGGLAGEFRAALEHVVGRQSQLETISIGPEDDMAKRRLDIVAAIRRVDTGSGVVVLTDMFGGTPSNLAISAMDEANVEVIAGINLPILVKLASIRGETPIGEAVARARDAGRKYIKVASQELSGEA